MKTPNQWLEEVKTNPERFNRWLSRQYKAEVDAANRIEALSTISDKKHQPILKKIANDEKFHAKLLSDICSKRNIKISNDNYSRYYEKVNLSKLSLDEMYAAGHYAEGMRLSRIKAIVNDVSLDSDIVSAFKIILKDEEMHEKAFGALASDSAKESVKSMHHAGVKALGLVI